MDTDRLDRTAKQFKMFLRDTFKAAVEDAVLVAADAVRHLVSKRGNTSPVIEEICGVIVGWAIGVTGRPL